MRKALAKKPHFLYNGGMDCCAVHTAERSRPVLQNQTTPSASKPIRKTTSDKKRRRRHRRPAVVFRASMLVFIWLICFLSCFVAYMIGKNMFDDKDKQDAAERCGTSVVCTL